MSEMNSIEKVNAAPPDISAPINVPAYPSPEKADGTAILLEYWRVLRKRKATVWSILLLVLVTVMIGTFKTVPTYKSSAVLQIDRENPNIFSFKEVFELDTSSDDYLETAYRILSSRTLAFRVVRSLSLDNMAEFTAKPSWLNETLHKVLNRKKPETLHAMNAEDQIDPKYEPIVNNFLDNLSITPVRRSRLVEISFESSDPVLASRVVNALASNYIDQNLEAKWDATQKASEWLSQQLVGLKAKLEKSEEEMQKYAKDNSILFLNETQSMSAAKLKELQEEGTRAEGDLFQKQSQYSQISSKEFASVPGILENKLYQDLSLKLADLRRDYSELSATFTPEYPKVKRLKSQIDETEAALTKQQAAFAQRVGDEYHAALSRKQLLDRAVDQQTKEFNQIAEKSIQYNILKRESETNRQLYQGLLERVKEAGVSAGMKASNIRIVDKGEIPTTPARPRVLLNVALALIAGLGLGVCMAFFQEYLDSSLKTPDDVQKYVGLPALGIIPGKNTGGRKFSYGYGERRSLKEADGESNTLVPTVAGASDNSQISEAYRSLRTAVLLSTSGRPPRVLLITSGQPGEGKTTTAVNLATTLSQLGGRVVLIDSDMRKPRVSTVLKLPVTTAGLSTYLTGQSTADEVVVPTKTPNLFVIPCGPIPPNPAELLSSAPMKKLLLDLTKKFDYVLLDSPPVLHVTDPQILATSVEAVILVSHGGKTPRDIVTHARNNLMRVNANLIGVVLNNVDFGSVGYEDYYRYYRGYGYGYGYGYGADEGDKKKSVSAT